MDRNKVKKFDFIIIGGGPGGCAAARTAARYRQRVALIESDKLGGLSLHRGCTPTKSMLVSARTLRRMQHSVDFGVSTNEDVQASLPDFLTRQRNVVMKLYDNLRHEIERIEDVQVFHGEACFTGPRKLEVVGRHESEVLEARKVIIATGSHFAIPPNVEVDGEVVLGCDDFLTLKEPPRHLAIIGGSNIACEYACILSALGTRITIIEKFAHLLPHLDPAIGKFIEGVFEGMGIEVIKSVEVEGARRVDDLGIVKLSDGRRVEGDRVILASGRKPSVLNLGLEEAGIHANGWIKVDSRMETSAEGVYAVGDVNGLLPMAHVAIAQARMAVLNALGEDHRFDTARMPTCLYTTPEVASVGWAEEDARKAGYEVIVEHVPLNEVGRVVAQGELSGFVKLVADSLSHKLIGGMIVGGQASEMIGQVTTALQLGATVEDFCGVVMGHPTISEALQEAAWALRHRLHSLAQ